MMRNPLEIPWNYNSPCADSRAARGGDSAWQEVDHPDDGGAAGGGVWVVGVARAHPRLEEGRRCQHVDGSLGSHQRDPHGHRLAAWYVAWLDAGG